MIPPIGAMMRWLKRRVSPPAPLVLDRPNPAVIREGRKEPRTTDEYREQALASVFASLASRPIPPGRALGVSETHGAHYQAQVPDPPSEEDWAKALRNAKIG